MGIVGFWEQEDNPFVTHRRHFPRCPFISGLPVGNEPIHEWMTPSAITERASAEPELDWTPTTTTTTWKDCEINLDSKPVTPSFLTISSRLDTFSDWPIQMKQKPRKLAESGFFYTGFADHVKCFYCDVSLEDWDSGDDEWEEHVKESPDCKHLILLKGKKYVKEILLIYKE